MRGFKSGFCLISLFTIAMALAPFSRDVAAAQQDKSLPTLAPVLAQASPSVVNVSVSTEAPAGDSALAQDTFFRPFLGATADPRLRAGSGVIVDAGQGHILTNHHIIADAQTIFVTLKDGRRLPAEFIGSDPRTGIALLKIKADDLVALPFADSDRLAVGDYVLAIGNPFGLGESITPGIIGGLGRPGLDSAGHENLIQTSVAITAGNSGGALVNLRGQLVGVNNMTIAPRSDDKGIGFAVPANAVRAAMEKLVAADVARHDRLGVKTQDVTPDLAETLDLEDTRGALVIELVKGSSADRVGIRSGDVIAAVDGEPVYGSAELESKIELFKGGDAVVLTVVRKGRGVPITTRFETFAGVGNGPTSLIPSASRSKIARAGRDVGGGPTALIPSASQAQVAVAGQGGGNGPNRLVPPTARSPVDGAVLRDRAAEGGVLVESVERGSPAWRDGLRQADVIASVNRIAVRDTAELESKLDTADRTVVLQVRRGASEKVVVLRR